MKKYIYKKTFHLFDDNDVYIGFFDENTIQPNKSDTTFHKWKNWDEQKHKDLLFLGFVLDNNVLQ